MFLQTPNENSVAFRKGETRGSELDEVINTHMLEANRQIGVQQYVTPLAKKPVQIRTDDDKRKRSA